MKAKARRARGDGEPLVIKSGGRDRLSLLYEISQILLTNRTSAAATGAAVFDVLQRALRLRSGVLVLECEAGRGVEAWPGEGAANDNLRSARARAKTVYRSLIGVDRRWDGNSARSPYIALPLVVSGGRIFGALQVEQTQALVEADLAFFNTVVNQLAVELARRSAIIAAKAAERARRLSAEARRASDQRDLGNQRFLADVSSALGASLDCHRTVPAAVARAVPFLADVCVVDAVDNRDRLERLAVAMAREDDPSLADKVMQAAKSRLSGGPLLSDFAASPSQPAASLIGVPLTAHGRVLGTLALAAVHSGRRYGAAELVVAEELAQRISLAIVNARLHEDAELAIRQRQDVLAMVAHDMRSPLNAILLVTQYLLQMPAAADRREGDRKKVEIVRRCADRMNRMIEDLLDSSSIEAGRFSLDIQSTALRPTLNHAVEAHVGAAMSKQLHVDVRMPDGDLVVMCDGARIIQVLSNLISNAVKFTPANGAITVTAECREDQALVRVTDTGPGIPADRLPRVFERYWKASETAHEGTGLGLFISRGIIEAHGERLHVESQAGKGVTFSFTLPIATQR